jgi:acetyl esterase/lipase/DNA-directed RNA polymerase subunit RPC12/RpoP
MSIRFTCNTCGKAFSVTDDLAGQRGKCKGCGSAIVIPGGTAQPAPLYVAPAPSPPDPKPAMDQTLKRLLIGGIVAIVLFLVGIISLMMTRSPSRPGVNASGTPGSVAPVAVASVPVFPTRPPPRRASGGVDVYQMTITGTGPALPMQVRLYLPAGRHDPQSLPCVFIAPAGTRLLHGSALDDGDTPEHLPYARAGFAVLAYELSGDVPNSHNANLKVRDLANPVRKFMDADGGLDNARVAIQLVLTTVPEVDPKQLFTAGHSSAATMALNLAAADQRIVAVAAYAPACDVEARWSANLTALNRMDPGATDFAAQVSPIKHVNQIACPVLLFHADDDTNVLTSDNQAYADALQAAGKSVEFSRVETGGHYQSMIDHGIPAGIFFFRTHGAHPLAPIR